MMTTTPQKERYLAERAGYATGIGIRTGIGGLLGYGAKKTLEGVGYVLDQFNNVVLPAAAQADQRVGKVIVEQGGKIGEAIVEVDKVQGDIWSNIFGRTPEQQKKWREEHGLEAPGYLEDPKTTVTVQVDARPVLQPTHYQQEFGHYGDGFLTAGLLLGGLWGMLRGWSPYRRAKQQRQLLRTQQALLSETQDLNGRIATLEQRSPRENTLEIGVKDQ